MSRRLAIAVLIDSLRSYRRNLLRGIAAYARIHGPWSFFHHELPLNNSLPPELKRWRGDGIIVRTENIDIINKLQKWKLPVVGQVNLYGCGRHYALEDVPIPLVESDQEAVMHLAVDHFREHGLKHFGYCLFSEASSVEQIGCKYFREYVEKLGCEVAIYEGPQLSRVAYLSSPRIACERKRKLGRWLKSLPKPVGIMGCNDRAAQQVLEVCVENNIAVPEEVAVIGVDNDDVLCELSDPPLSSIDPNAQRMGYEMAALLHKIIRGETVPSAITLVPPLGVIARESTDVTAISDHKMAIAMRFIRRHACEGIDVSDVCRHVCVSRSTLERRFKAAFGCSPRGEIHRVQIARIQELLTHTDYPLEKIAAMTGFNYVESMCYSFKNATGKTPGEYRKQLQV